MDAARRDRHGRISDRSRVRIARHVDAVLRSAQSTACLGFEYHLRRLAGVLQTAVNSASPGAPASLFPTGDSAGRVQATVHDGSPFDAVLAYDGEG